MSEREFDPLFNAGIVYLRYKDWFAARDAFERCLRLDSRSAPVRLNLAMAYLRLGQFSSAEEHARAASEIDHGSAPARFLLSEILRNKGDLQGALIAARDSVRLDPTEPIAHDYLAIVYFMLGRYEKALESQRRAMRYARGWSPSMHVLAGDALAGLEQYDAALKEYEKVIAKAALPALEVVGMDPTAAAWRGKGTCHLYLGLRGDRSQFQLSADALETALQLDGRDSRAWMMLAPCLRHVGKYESALDAIDRAIRLAGRLAHLACERGLILFGLHHGDAAAAEFQYVATAATETQLRRDAKTWLPYSLLIAERYEECIAAADRSIEEGIDNAKVRTARAMAWLHKNEVTKSQEDLECARAIAPRDPVVLANLANLARIRGRIEEAKAVIADALAAGPNNADVWFVSFLVLMEEQKGDEAARLVEDAKARFAAEPKKLKQLLSKIDGAALERTATLAIERIIEIESSAEPIRFAEGVPLEGLEHRLAEFNKLLDKPGVREEEIKQFLKSESSRFIFGLNAIRTHTEHELGSDFQADFILEFEGPRYVLVELESPNMRLYTKNGKSAALSHGCQQVEDWQHWFDENNPYAQKKLPGCISPEGMVIIGRRRGLSPVDAQRLARSNVTTRGKLTVLTYDDLLVDARAVLVNLLTSRQNVSDGDR